MKAQKEQQGPQVMHEEKERQKTEEGGGEEVGEEQWVSREVMM